VEIAFMSKPRYTVIAPCWNEEGNLPELYRRIKEVLEQTNEPWELLLINDGSTDRTAELMRELNQTDPRVHFCRVRPQFRPPAGSYRRYGLRPGRRRGAD
jgi:glycosyltransferase involved in cell wall biosynthesis